MKQHVSASKNSMEKLTDVFTVTTVAFSEATFFAPIALSPSSHEEF